MNATNLQGNQIRDLVAALLLLDQYAKTSVERVEIVHGTLQFEKPADNLEIQELKRTVSKLESDLKSIRTGV